MLRRRRGVGGAARNRVWLSGFAPLPVSEALGAGGEEKE